MSIPLDKVCVISYSVIICCVSKFKHFCIFLLCSLITFSIVDILA